MAVLPSTPAPPIAARAWFVLAILAVTGQIAWAVENAWFNTFVFDMLTPDPRPVAWMVAASAITATLTTLLMGTLSDHTRCIGTCADPSPATDASAAHAFPCAGRPWFETGAPMDSHPASPIEPSRPSFSAPCCWPPAAGALPARRAICPARSLPN